MLPLSVIQKTAMKDYNVNTSFLKTKKKKA